MSNTALKIKSGDRFGRWTVLDSYITTEKNERKWLCRCDCGTERHVLERSLRNGGSLSCGCQRKENAMQTNTPDLTGRRFGQLTVISRAENDKHRSSRWVCRCDCGQEYTVRGTLLTTGKVTRCPGEAHVKTYAYSDIAGQKFSMLTALYPTDRRSTRGSVIWHCKCDCGREADVSYNSLLYGRQQSCGCKKTENDKKLHTRLTRAAGTSIDMIKSKKLPSNSTTGHKGVYLIKGKYVAKIVFQKKQYFLGTYDTMQDAVEARKEAEEALFDAAAAHYHKWKQYADINPKWGEENPIRIMVDKTGTDFRVTLIPDLSVPPFLPQTASCNK